MADNPEKSFDDQLEEAYAGIDGIAEVSPYNRELLMGAYATVSALGDNALASETISLERRTEIQIEAAKRALVVAETKKDSFIASMMGTIQSQGETILGLAKKPATPPAPAKKAKPDPGQSSKPKR